MTAVTAAVGLGMISQPATAKAATPAASVRKVPVADLDLTRERDAAVLIERVTRAARVVCAGSYEGWRPYISQSGWYRDCVRGASRRAVAEVDSPMVTALYEGGPRPFLLAANSPQP